jgi:hypothetical protein
MNDVILNELLEVLADLTLEGPNFEVALAALRLQTELINFYGRPDQYYLSNPTD